MKNKTSFLVGFALCACLFTLAGCGMGSKISSALYKTTPGGVIGTNVIVTPAQTNIVATPAITNEVVRPAVIDMATGVVIPATTNITVTLPQITQTITPAVTNFVPVFAPDKVETSPGVSAGVQFISALPIPWAGTVGFALTSLLSLGAAWKNKRLAVGVVQSVDAARQWIRATPEGKAVDAQLLHVLEQHQEAAGIYNAVSGIVDRYTGKTTATVG